MNAHDKESAEPLPIQAWRQRVNWQSTESAAKLMVEAMKAEIADLRAALSSPAEAGGKYASVNHWLLSLEEGEQKHVNTLGKWELAERVWRAARAIEAKLTDR